MKIEKLYSYYQEKERLYSTGNDELDDLLERDFCEGYEYAQREFAKRDYEGLSKRQQKVLKRLRDGKAKELRDNRKAVEWFQKMDKETTGNIGNVEININKLKYKSGSKPNGSGMGKAAIENYLKDSAEDAKRYRKFVEENVPKDGLIKRGWNKLGKGGKAAVIGVPVAAAALGTGMAIKKHNDKKKKEQE